MRAGRGLIHLLVLLIMEVARTGTGVELILAGFVVAYLLAGGSPRVGGGPGGNPGDRGAAAG
jgi:hypothetical protein